MAQYRQRRRHRSGNRGCIACGLSVICGVAVGAAAGAAMYTASNAYTKKFTGKGLAIATGAGALTGLAGAGARVAGPVGNLLAKSRLGTLNKYLGNNKFVNPAGYGKFAPGKWNMPGRNFKIGWSNIGDRYVLRIGIGKKSPNSNISRWHINLVKGGKVRGW